ncbi:MAG: hypothetical protein M3066_20225 [Actinomycetota bacterium]|nr:hypothetical protein [Actinomycetota bacterium]
MRRTHARRLALAVAVLMPVTAGLMALGGPSSADVTAVRGSAYGSFLHVSIFGSPFNDFGPDPIVTLPAGGSVTPVTATAATQAKRFGPATFFTSGPVTVSTQGTSGPGGSVTSSTSTGPTNTSTQESLTATTVASTCTASETGVSGSATFTGGTLQTDNGDDAAGDVHSPVEVPLPVNPAPNTTITGHIHVNGSQDNFKFVLNEQTVNPDGSLTVSAFHEYLLGPTAIGDLIVGQVTCGVTATVSTTTTTVPATTTTTRPATTTTTVPATTTTTVPATTTTTRASTTTTIGNGTTSTTIGTGTNCAQLRSTQAQFNAQIAAVRAAIVGGVPADQQGPILAQLAAVQAQGNAQIAQALAAGNC